MLLGMGGSGKTQLALELCRQAEENLGYMAVIWINASSPVSVMQSYKAVAKKISKGRQDGANSEDVISLVQDTLQEWRHPWLFVFDNYDIPTAFQFSSIRNYIPRGKEGRILFTSRHEDSARLGHKVEVSGMTKDESLKVLLQRSPLNDEELIHGREIAATLGYHVLALDQAGSYLRAHRLRLRDFVSHYHRRKEVILKAIPDEWEYRRTIGDEQKETNLRIFTTWELSFEQISGREEEIQQKEHFLSLAAFFDVTAISERNFEAYFKAEKPKWMGIFHSEGRWDSDKLGDVLAEFRKLSLLQVPNAAVAEHVFSVHPVVRDWIQTRKSREIRQQLVKESIIMLTTYLQSVDFNDLPLETKQETLLHVDSCVRHDRDLLSGSSHWSFDDDWIAASWFAVFYIHQGRYDEAEKLYGRALVNAKEKLEAADSEISRIMIDLASVYRYQGRYNEAEKLHKQVLIDVEKTPGFEASTKLATMQRIANTYSQQGQYEETKKLYERGLTDYEEKLGVRHPNTLKTMGGLANTYFQQGRYNEAERLYKRALTGNEEKLGAKHPVTLRSIEGLACVFSKQGRYNEAEKLYKRVLTDNEERVGAKHPDTLKTIHNLANLYLDQGRYNKAENLYERALIGRKEKLGSTHPSTLSSMQGLAIVFSKQGRYDEAEKLYERVLTANEEKLGAKHPNTLRTIHNLANLCLDQGRYDEAETLYERALIGRKEKLGATHPDTLRIMYNLANLYLVQGRYNEAEKLYKRVLIGRKEKLGVTHLDTLDTAKHLAILYQRQGRDDEAVKLIQEFNLTI